jgi:hypothetical protein
VVALVSGRRLGLGALALAASLLAVFWTTREWGSTPPLYDGLPLQSEPYRYLQPSPGQATTAPPTSASQNVKPSGNLPFIVNTNESPPQAELQAAPDAFAIPPTVQGIVVTITPVPPAVPLAHLDGNVYRTAVTTPDGTAVSVTPGRQVTVLLRGTGASGRATVEQLANGRWTPLSTSIPSPGYHAASASALGDFALALKPASGGLGAGLRAAIAVAAVLVVIGLLLVAVRVLRR